MSFKVRFTGSIRFPRLDFTEQMMESAEKDIISDMAARIQNRIDINSVRYKPLAESTKRAKKRKGQLKVDKGHQLIDTGELHKSFKFRKKAKNQVLIFIGNVRKRIATILQNDGVKSKLYGKRKFEFFGISKEAEEASIKRVEEYIEKNI